MFYFVYRFFFFVFSSILQDREENYWLGPSCLASQALSNAVNKKWEQGEIILGKFRFEKVQPGKLMQNHEQQGPQHRYVQ